MNVNLAVKKIQTLCNYLLIYFFFLITMIKIKKSHFQSFQNVLSKKFGQLYVNYWQH
jgi:hypothetical protein